MPKMLPNLFMFTPLERLIFSSLESEKSLLPSALTRKTEASRTTLIRALKNLHDRGLIESTKMGKRNGWKRIPQGVLEKNLLTSAKQIGISVTGLEVPGFRLVRGADALTQEFWYLIESLPRNGRLAGIQPTQSGLHSTKKMGTAEVIRINEYIKKRGIIVEAILEENFINELLKRHGSEWLKSFIGRAASTAMIPDEYLQYLADIYLAGDRAVLANWDSEIGVVIDNRDVVELLRSMFKFLHDSGKRLDNSERGRLLLQKEIK